MNVLVDDEPVGGSAPGVVVGEVGGVGDVVGVVGGT